MLYVMLTRCSVSAPPGEPFSVGGMDGQADMLPARYRAPRRIARGGMGEIFSAEDSVLDRTVAIKVLAERYAHDESIRGRFTREALAAARLSSAPNTVTIFDVGESGGRPFIVMELLPGGSLEDRLRRDGLQPPAQALAWLEQAARALDAAHAAGVVHRDVKPANLLLDGADEIHVADFGIASAAGLDSLTHPGTILGTAGYLSPEQARGEPAGPAADRYAFAVVAFELLTGRRPYEHEHPTAEATAHVQAPIPAATSVRPELPPYVDDVFQVALAKHPSERYGSCAELVLALRDAFDDAEGSTQVRAAPVPSAAPRASERTERSHAPARAPRRRRRSPALLPLALVGLLAAGLAGVALASLLGNDGQQEAASPEMVVTTVHETLEGTTVHETVTQEVPAAPAEPAPAEEPPAQEPAPAAGDGASGAQLNDRGFARMQQGDYAGALPLLEAAVSELSGSGQLAEAYALYNLAYTRLQLGQCDGVVEMLDRSEQIQGRRTEIDRARGDAAERC
jgi:eukaryotic-like serine/threonine-protein kinase